MPSPTPRPPDVPLSEAEVAELRRLEQAASRPPWESHSGNGDGPCGFMYDVICPGEETERRVLLQLNHNFRENIDNDRRFIAAARNALSRLISAAESLAREQSALRECLQGTRELAATIADLDTKRRWAELLARAAHETVVEWFETDGAIYVGTEPSAMVRFACEFINGLPAEQPDIRQALESALAKE